jgi:hypothetical protein
MEEALSWRYYCNAAMSLSRRRMPTQHSLLQPISSIALSSLFLPLTLSGRVFVYEKRILLLGSMCEHLLRHGHDILLKQPKIMLKPQYCIEITVHQTDCYSLPEHSAFSVNLLQGPPLTWSKHSERTTTVYTQFWTPVPCEKGHTWPKTN